MNKTNTKTTKKKAAPKKESGIGAGSVLALAGAAMAAIAGGVYFYGKNSAKNKRELKSWMLRAKADILDKVGKAKDMKEEKYAEVVDVVMKKYQKAKDIKNTEIAELATELKSHWKEIAKHAGASVKETKSTVKKAVKKIAK
jgi:uncharacterized protein HemX